VKKTLVSWSSGKDSAWLVQVLRATADVELGAMLTTVNESAQRVAMHAVRVELLEAQAAALGLPLWQVPIPSPCPN
jgi:diphthamide synthase (EF-2-diphthine--ammonia ligase)